MYFKVRRLICNLVDFDVVKRFTIKRTAIFDYMNVAIDLAIAPIHAGEQEAISRSVPAPSMSGAGSAASPENVSCPLGFA